MSLENVVIYGDLPNQKWRNLTVTTPVDTSGYEQTGVVEEIIQKGLIEVPENVGAGTMVQTTTRWQTDTEPGPGLGFGTKTITKTYYTNSSESGGEDGDLGLSAENPNISINASLVTKSILLHPTVAEVMKNGGIKAAALKLLAQGGSTQDMMWDPDTRVQKTVSEIVGDGPEVALVLSASEFYDVQYTATCTWEVDRAAIAASTLQISIKSPPGVGNIQGRNWLYTGTSYRTQGGKYIASATYILSGPGGWDTKIYS